MEALQKAFMDTLADPELLADAKRANFDVNPVSGPEVAALIAKAYAAPKSVVQLVKKALDTAY